jgi:3-dehydro-L-gulonate-6-phosphate decarboxylase
MKLQITYNFSDITQALEIANHTAEHADILGIGSLLIYKNGVESIKKFKSLFPSHEIFIEIPIFEKAQDTVALFAKAGASYVSVLAGASHSTIKKTIETAKNYDIKIALDLLDAHSHGQSAHDAKTLGVDLVIIHRTVTTQDGSDYITEWQNVRENTKLPVFVTGKIDRVNIQQIIDLKPQGIIIGAAIIKADNPAQEAKYFKSLM